MNSSLQEKYEFPINSLVYNTDSLSLVGKLGDELSAYRTKRQWLEVLANYFLLEPNRDFALKISASENSDEFTLECSFSSACGRYAFWRLINQQAPEAEERLGCGWDNLTAPIDPEGPWVLSDGVAQQLRRKRSLREKLSAILPI